LQDALPQERKTGTSIALTFHELEAVDLVVLQKQVGG
jgi:hypothetical protein